MSKKQQQKRREERYDAKACAQESANERQTSLDFLLFPCLTGSCFRHRSRSCSYFSSVFFKRNSSEKKGPRSMLGRRWRERVMIRCSKLQSFLCFFIVLKRALVVHLFVTIWMSIVMSLIPIVLIKKAEEEEEKLERKRRRKRKKEIVSGLAYWGEIIRWIVLVFREADSTHMSIV